MLVRYDPILVALSVLIAMQGGYVSLRLASRLADTTGVMRKAMLVASAASLGCGIWAMHFIGMLALELPVTVNYDVLLTLVSFLVSILVTGIGVYIAGFGAPSLPRLAGGGAFMGLGIAAMHYVGMSAVRANCLITYSPTLIVLSIVIGIAASILALWLAISTRTLWQTFAGAATMGLAISGMHYTAMAAATFQSLETLVELSAPTISQNLLAIVVAVATFVICGFFLLFLVPDKLTKDEETATDRDWAADVEPSEAADEALLAEKPMRRLAVKKNKTTVFLDMDQIYSIQADEHYTHVFDGTDTYFCPHSVSEMETMLDPEIFVRVHRSHIVNIRHARSFRRRQERGELVLDGDESRSVPVSRGNVPKLRAALGI